MNNNVIQIKRGDSHPGNILQPYEPGIDISDDNRLYIGGQLKDGETTGAQDIKAGRAGGLILDKSQYGTDDLSTKSGVPGQVYFWLLTE